MEIGIQYTQLLSIEHICESDMGNIELPVIRAENIPDELFDKINNAGGKIIGIELKLREILSAGDYKKKDILIRAVDIAQRCKASYIVIDTENMDDNCPKELENIIISSQTFISQAGMAIYIENGYRYINGKYYYNAYSDAGRLLQFIDKLKELCPEIDCGICVNIGHANLLGINIRDMIRQCGSYIKLVHVNDNDGYSDQHQMPYTFTVGRGYPATDWVHIIGMLYKTGYNGYYIFNNIGTWKRTPQRLHMAMLKLTKAVGQEWLESCYKIEKYLNQPDKKLILFGAGRMAASYMEAWGDKYRPDYFVDNNPDKWGEELMGIPILPPEEILSLTKDERNVWICNINYDAIGRQLDYMGVSYRCYYDHYYMDHII